MPLPDVCIAGAGIIGLSLALELHRRGAQVTVLEAGTALAQTSSAAAGMLAANDPANPAPLLPLSQLSASLYPQFLDEIASLSGEIVPFQTETTLQERIDGHPEEIISPETASELIPGSTTSHLSLGLLTERSVDPRQLAQALRAAVLNTTIDLRENTSLRRIQATPTHVRVETSTQPVGTAYLVDCMAAWSPAPVAPRKGQMLAVRIPPTLALDVVLRTEDIYIVPRTAGPNAGRAIIGATLEDAGFDLTVHPKDILDLHARAVRLLPALEQAEFLESWAGLRPATSDTLPLLGPVPSQPRYLLATGHFRNGILLAPATAHVITQLLAGENPIVDLQPFSPNRPLSR
jgi:glycine oxidase